ncbi:dihydrofolate reductase family protein [Xylanimonas ulmi]|uniref:Riboflavin biosynthesis pyrimidine reductase n=1 Tax=Xylanimonas ulmi TaxID=228973 RepID=A0A4Q7M104_9MICO|nr:dihydrofolate reductase family protein [Xylanibacterium ulmi]RZS61064.1 riboflavin biosynthesis pyrimidine reductase [Xylanibacterium ulmi]
MAGPALTLLAPQTRPLPDDDGEAALAALYRHEPAVVRANMVASVDGAAWGGSHRSGDLNDDADLRVFRVLRALADVVVVGAGTAREEGYDQIERPADLAHLAEGAAPLRLALVSRSGLVPPSTLAGDRPPLVITGEAGATAARGAVGGENVLVHGAQEPDLRAGLADLAARGLTRVLTEGGPHLLGSLHAAGLVDELCLTTSAVVEGPAPGRILAGAQAPRGRGPRRSRLAHLLHDPAAGTLLARWLVPSDAPTADGLAGFGT